MTAKWRVFLGVTEWKVALQCKEREFRSRSKYSVADELSSGYDKCAVPIEKLVKMSRRQLQV